MRTTHVHRVTVRPFVPGRKPTTPKAVSNFNTIHHTSLPLLISLNPIPVDNDFHTIFTISFIEKAQFIPSYPTVQPTNRKHFPLCWLT